MFAIAAALIWLHITDEFVQVVWFALLCSIVGMGDALWSTLFGNATLRTRFGHDPAETLVSERTEFFSELRNNGEQ
ncbi:hypothetical protein CGZ80_11125 [Rhodopirellula sp. MGV]|nr:hypothetical protein CGZ80_11125 [Rhodopirellula sp. MGV]PNY34042.1 hypothetical protein C2E31_25415 [Rhodopirellula baltica]PNY35651.1 hypothetical protein C2E31_17090 [Rhodopirellula baltica]